MDALIRAGMKQAQNIYDLAEKYEQPKVMEDMKKIIDDFMKLFDRMEKIVKKVKMVEVLESNYKK